MTTTEDNWTVETTIEETTPAVEETTPAVEAQVVEEAQEVIDERVQNLSTEDIDSLLKAITEWIEWEEEIPSRPVNFEKQEEEPISDEDIDTTIEVMEALDTQIEEKDAEIERINTELGEIKTKYETEAQKVNAIEDIWSKVLENPVIWKFALQIANWETPDIPDIIQKQLQKEIDSIPKIQDTEQVSIKPKVETAADRITKAATW